MRFQRWIKAGVGTGSSLAIGLLLAFTQAYTQDPNYHVYLAFGQSNMEGNGQVPAAEKTGVNARFQVMSAVNCTNLSRTKGNWYTAVPPLCRCNTGMTPADYFGRTLVDSLPTIKVGVINVSVAGCAIEMFDKAKYQSYISGQADWMKNIANEYGGNPYGTLVDLAKKAQQTGVIKGFLLHQGESGSSTNQWANEVKTIYNNLIQDLGLDAAKTPLLAGDLVNSSTMVKNLPNTLPNSYVISSQGLGKNADNLHFSPDGYKEFGKRYAATMLTILKQNGSVGVNPERTLPGYALDDKADFRNGSTLGFAIPAATYVSLKVHTLAGAEIAELAGRWYAPGKHAVGLGARALPRGLYLVSMKADAFTAERKILIGGN